MQEWVDRRDASGASPLFAAMQSLMPDCVRMLADRSSDDTLNHPSTSGESALMWAARLGHSALAHHLLRRKVNTDIVLPDGMTLLVSPCIVTYGHT